MTHDLDEIFDLADPATPTKYWRKERAKARIQEIVDREVAEAEKAITLRWRGELIKEAPHPSHISGTLDRMGKFADMPNGGRLTQPEKGGN